MMELTSQEKMTVNIEDKELMKYDKWLAEFVENLEVLLAESRVDEALETLDKGESVVDEARDRRLLTPSASMSLQNSLMEQRQKSADQLAEAACQPSTSGFELRSYIQAMKKLGDGPGAHSLFIISHKQKLHRNMQSLRSCGSSLGTTYTTTLSHLVFSSIAQAVNDSLAIFDDEPAFTSELVTWAVNQADGFALLMKRNVIAVPAASGSLRIVTECILICLRQRSCICCLWWGDYCICCSFPLYDILQLW